MSTCTCHYEDVGNGETGPSLSMTPDENCPDHGRFADPEPWAEADRFERGYALSAFNFMFGRGGALNVELDDDLVMGLVKLAEKKVDTDLPEDDGHNFDRAIGLAADALRGLITAKVAA